MTLEAQTTPAPAADTGTMSIAEGAAQLKAERLARNNPQVEPEEAETGEEITTDEPQEADDVVEQDSDAAPQAADDGEEAPETDTLEVEQAEEVDPAKPTLDAPARWDAKGKELFAKLPADAKDYILGREKLQQAEITKAQQKSAEVTKTFETRIQHLNALAETIGEHYVDPGLERMEDWKKWFASDDARQLARSDPGAYLEEQARYEQERVQLGEAVKAKRKAEGEAFAKFREEQGQQMLELIPEFADEVEGGKRKSELGTYLRDQGFDSDRIAGISAKEAQLAWKSKKFDAIEARFANGGGLDALIRDAELYRKSVKLATKPPPPKPKVNAGPSAPPAGQGQRPSSSEMRIKQLQAMKNPSATDMAELLKLERKQKG